MQAGQARPGWIIEIAEHNLQEVVDRALLDNQAAIHVGLADGQCRVEEQALLGPAVGDAGGDGVAPPVAEGMGSAIGVGQAQISRRNDLIEDVMERPKH